VGGRRRLGSDSFGFVPENFGKIKGEFNIRLPTKTNTKKLGQKFAKNGRARRGNRGGGQATPTK